MAAATGTDLLTLRARPTLTERQSLIIVGAAHFILLAALSLALRSVTPPAPPAEADAVEIVSASEARTAAAPAPPPPASPQAPVPPQVTPAPPEPAVEPKPEPKPPVEKPLTIKPDKPKPDKPKPDKPKPEKAKPDRPTVAKSAPTLLDAEALSSQLDKALPKSKSKAKSLDMAALSKSVDAAVPKAGPRTAKATATTIVRGDPRAAAAIAAAIRAQVTPCWNLPVGAAQAGKVTALLHIDINRDGSIAGRPAVVSQTGVTAGNADYARAFAETARRAVLRCAPLKLPADQYDQWKAVEINFDPTSM